MKRLFLVLLALAMMTAHFAMAEDAIESVPMPAEAAAFEGVWQCDRASVEMYWEEEGFRVMITWGSSAWEQSVWQYSCYYHEDTKTVVSMPFGMRTDYVYGDDGEIVSATDAYNDGEATFLLDDEGYLIWQDEKENAGEGMRFEKLPGEAPLFGTVGEAMESEGFTGMYGMDGKSYAVIVELDGQIIRAVAAVDEKLLALNDAIGEAEDIEAAFAAAEEYAKTLPVLYTETITAAPVDQAELDALRGKTVNELEEEGYEYSGSFYGGEDDLVVFTMTKGLYEYEFVMNESPELYEALSESSDFGQMTVRSGKPAGISYNVTDLRYHADGTVSEEEEEDPWAIFSDLGQMITEAFTTSEEDGKVDTEAIVERIVELAPDQEEEIRLLADFFTSIYEMSTQNAE